MEAMCDSHDLCKPRTNSQHKINFTSGKLLVRYNVEKQVYVLPMMIIIYYYYASRAHNNAATKNFPKFRTALLYAEYPTKF